MWIRNDLFRIRIHRKNFGVPDITHVIEVLLLFFFFLNLTINQKEKSTNNLPFSILNYSSTVLQSRIFRLKYYEIQLLPDVEKSTINFRHGEHVRAAGSGAEAVRGEHAQEDPGHRGEAPTHTRQAPKREQFSVLL